MWNGGHVFFHSIQADNSLFCRGLFRAVLTVKVSWPYAWGEGKTAVHGNAVHPPKPNIVLKNFP